jgi:hypothetical protein
MLVEPGLYVIDLPTVPRLVVRFVETTWIDLECFIRVSDLLEQPATSADQANLICASVNEEER